LVNFAFFFTYFAFPFAHDCAYAFCLAYFACILLFLPATILSFDPQV